MRIAVLSCFNGIWNGGGESWSVDICRYLQQQGHTCVLVQGGAQPPPDVPFRTVALGVTPHHRSAPPATRLVSKLINRCYLNAVDRDVARISRRALPHLLAFRPDVVLPVNNLWSILAAKLVRALTRGQARVVVTGHTRGWDRVERDAVRLGIDGFVAVQPRAYEDARRFAGAGTPVRLIPNAVDLDRFAHAEAALVPLTPPVALVVSSLLDYKRVDLAVRAAAQADVSLLVVGDGPNAARIDGLGNALLGPSRFLRLPHVPHHAVPAYYRAVQAFTLPSEEGEAFGVVILEAMAAGLPVVVNDDAVRRWIVGDNGLFVDPTDTDAYARALQLAVVQPRVDYVESLVRFRWPVVAAAYAQFFDDLRTRRALC